MQYITQMENINNNCMIECIFSYNNKEQDHGEMMMVINDVMTEEMFLTKIFDEMFNNSLVDLDDLYKLSCCIYNYNGNENTEFIKIYTQKKGKYFFDNEERYNDLKKNYIISKNKEVLTKH